MFDHKHYVPILKTKAGERWAIANLRQRTKSFITPLFEVHKHRTMSAVEYAPELCEDLASVWGTDLPFFMDTTWLHGATGDAEIIHAVFESARNSGLQAIPVVRRGYDDATYTEIQAIVAEDGLGYLLRLLSNTISDAATINDIVQHIGVPISSAHLMVDYRTVSMNLPIDLPQIPNLSQWQTLIAASGVFPASVSGIPIGNWNIIQRNDWMSWIEQLTSGQLPRQPAFSDYAMRSPGAPSDFGDPSVNLRYAKSAHWIVRVGGRFKQGHAPDMFRICQELVARPEFDGQNFSVGDQAIFEVATQVSGPGAPQQWLQWCMNHHIEFTSQEIRNHPLL
ncbi:MAG: beta family protein [Planctomycetaceae bacterium]|nr:beta family protein [Planctomycetaceae bacterium]